MEAVRATLAGAWRNLRRAPRLTMLIVGMLGTGMGATVAIFSHVSLLLLRPLPGVADPGTTLSVERSGGAGVIDIFSYPDYVDLHDRLAPYAELAGFRRTSLDVHADATERVSGALVTTNYFTVLGARARLGRTFDAQDWNASVAVISDGCWRRLLGADPNAVGRALRISGHPFTIVGVLSPPFAGTYPGQPDSVWLPLSAQPIVLPRMSTGVLANRNSRWVQIMGRLQDGTSLPMAADRIATAGRAIASAFPGDHLEGQVTLRSGLGLASDDRGEMAHLLGLLSAAAGLLLFIGCGNAANLLLARAEDRRREVAVRRALGAGLTRLAGEMLAEGLLLALAAGAVGLWIAPAANAWLLAFASTAYGIRPETVTVDWRAWLFALSVSGFVAVACTIVPLRRVASTDAGALLRSGGRGEASRRTLTRSWLVALQVAFSVMLAAGAGLSLRSIAKITRVQPGYATTGVVLATYALDLHGYTPSRSADFFARLADALRSHPDVQAVSWSTAVPPEPYSGTRSVFRRGEAPSQQALQQREQELGVRADLVRVSPAFFDTMGIAIEHGRAFDDHDAAGAQRVAIVNRALAERLWPGEQAVGRFLEAPPYSGAVPPPMQVVGIARDTRHRSIVSDAPVRVLYLPYLQEPDPRATLIVRTPAGAAALAPLLRRAAARVDPDVPAVAIQDVAAYDAATLWKEHSVAAAFALFAVFGLGVAGIGVYAALAHDVASRRRELAVRVALGASVSGLSALVVRDAMRVASFGAVAGIILSLAASGRLRDVLFSVSTHDPLTFAAVPAALLVIALLASAIPARQAARANPIDALRLD